MGWIELVRRQHVGIMGCPYEREWFPLLSCAKEVMKRQNVKNVATCEPLF